MRYPLNSVQEVQVCMTMLQAQGIGCEWSGLCVWIAKDARLSAVQERDYRNAGMSYARKRGQFFFRACEGLPKKIDVPQAA